MYQSPFHLAGITAPIIDKKDLQLARKKLLAELELAGGTTIRINNTQLTRQDIIHLFDELDTEFLYTCHLAIANDDALLAFLEHAVITEQSWQQNPMYETSQFLDFISPKFAESVNELLRQCLKQNQSIGHYNTIVHRTQLLLIKDVDACFLYARHFFLERKAELMMFTQRLEDKANGQHKTVIDPITRASTVRFVLDIPVSHREVESWCTSQQLMLLNALPDEHFGDMRYDLAHKLNDICVICDRQKAHYRVAYTALQVAITIHCSIELKTIIRDNLQIIYGKLYSSENYKTEAPSSPNMESDFSWKTMLFIVLILIRIAGCLAH